MAVDPGFNPSWSFDHATTGTVEYNNGNLSNISDGDTLKYNYSSNGDPLKKNEMNVTITFKAIVATPTIAPTSTPAPTEIVPTPTVTTPAPAIVAPKTGDSMPIGLIVGLIMLSFAVIGFFAYNRKSGKQKDL